MRDERNGTREAIELTSSSRIEGKEGGRRASRRASRGLASDSASQAEILAMPGRPWKGSAAQTEKGRCKADAKYRSFSTRACRSVTAACRIQDKAGYASRVRMLAVGGAIRQSLSRGVVRPSPCKPRRGGEALVSTRLMTLREVIYPPNDPPKRSPGLCPPNDSVRTLTVAEKPLPLESSRPGGGRPACRLQTRPASAHARRVRTGGPALSRGPAVSPASQRPLPTPAAARVERGEARLASLQRVAADGPAARVAEARASSGRRRGTATCGRCSTRRLRASELLARRAARGPGHGPSPVRVSSSHVRGGYLQDGCRRWSARGAFCGCRGGPTYLQDAGRPRSRVRVSSCCSRRQANRRRRVRRGQGRRRSRCRTWAGSRTSPFGPGACETL